MPHEYIYVLLQMLIHFFGYRPALGAKLIFFLNQLWLEYRSHHVQQWVNFLGLQKKKKNFFLFLVPCWNWVGSKIVFVVRTTVKIGENLFKQEIAYPCLVLWFYPMLYAVPPRNIKITEKAKFVFSWLGRQEKIEDSYNSPVVETFESWVCNFLGTKGTKTSRIVVLSRL